MDRIYGLTIMIFWFILIAAVVILFIIPFVDGWTGKHTFSRLYGVTYQEIITDNTETDNESEKDELHDLNRSEQIEIQEQTLIQYNKLLDNLADQYINETNEKKKAVILSKQIAVLEKYNRALEKMEKLNE